MKVVDAGSGVGGTWYWNRYPEQVLTLLAIFISTYLTKSYIKVGVGLKNSLGNQKSRDG